MKFGINIETKEYEKVWNAFRFATTTLKRNHEVKEKQLNGLHHEKYDVDTQLQNFLNAGGEILACGTCLKSRRLDETAPCPISTIIDCVNMVEWADKVITF